MLISKFVSIFSYRADVAIEPQTDVLKALLEFGCKDEVEFYPDPQMNAGIVRGTIEHYERVIEGEKVYGAKITYSERMPLEWQRLIACKELLHILDPIESRDNNADQIDHLASKIVLPPELQDPADGYGVLTDRIMIAFAVAVMFPMGARSFYVREMQTGKATLQTIASEVGIPFEYVKAVMSETWPDTHLKLVTLHK